MNCVHGVRADKPCPDCEYEATCRERGVKPENRWQPITCRCNARTEGECRRDCLMKGYPAC